MDKSYFQISKEIQKALKDREPIVALESTLISHGLPYPENLNVAQSSIDAVKKSGSVPATIAIINGKIKIGLSNYDINILSKSKNVEKVSKHNFILALNNKINAATTVSSTIYIASILGIKFFATGGIGGVHHNAKNTFDISSDLNELSKTNMFVVCSGAKSILDLDKTYEYLESLGIPRIGYKTDYMPGFWYYQTDKKVDFNFIKMKELTNYLKIHENLKQDGSVLIFNPVAKNKSINKNLIEKWIRKSLQKNKNNKIVGKDLTPYLIKEINAQSNNKTLNANIDLIINNALLAGELAYCFNKIN